MAVFEERTRDREPSGTFGLDVANWTRTYVLYDQLGDGTDVPVRSQDLYDRITRIIGGTNPGPSPRPLGSPGGAGSLDRLMPMCDPQFPSLFADPPAVRVNNMEGYSSDQYGLGGLLAVPPTVERFALYKGVEFTIPFSARPYAVVPNSRMTMSALDFYAEDGTRRRLNYYLEWKRFTQQLWHAIDSRISASVGSSMVFRVPSSVGSPNKDVYTAVPDVLVNDMGLKLRWFAVPLRYLTSGNSYLTRYRGYVNQFPFLGKVKGAFLYVGPEVIRTYTPPKFLPADTADPFLQGTFDPDVLMDVELSFIFTARRRFAAEAGPGDISTDPDRITDAERPNKSWIDGPMNWLLHWTTKRWYYAHANVPNVSGWVPQYLSVPYEILFADPDVAGQVFVI